MTELEKLRDNIDRIDEQLIALLTERFRFSSLIGQIKGKEGIAVLQSDRWDEIMSSRKEYAAKAGLSELFIEDFLQLIHRESIRIQDAVNKETGKRPGQ
jgi:chorismate mutase